MFVGHAGVGFASKTAAPRASLGWLLAAPFLLDFLWPLFVLAGLETATIEPGPNPFLRLSFDSYPWSHSLAMALFWGLVYGAVVHFFTRDSGVGFVAAAGVFSHWICDAVVHRPDLPLWPGSSVYVGMGLWNSVPATLAVELSLFGSGLWLYLRTTRPADGVGRWALAGLAVFFVGAYAASILGPPPPNMTAVAVTALLLALVVPWALWIDRHRREIS